MSCLSAFAQSAKFTLVNLDVKRVAATVQHFTGQPIRLAPEVRGTVTLVSPAAIGGSDAMALLANVANEHGWQAETDARGGVFIFPADGAGRGLPVVERTYVLKHKAVAEISPELRKSLSPYGSVAAADDHRLLVVDVPSAQHEITRRLVEFDVTEAIVQDGPERPIDDRGQMLRLETKIDEARLAVAIAGQLAPVEVADKVEAASQNEKNDALPAKSLAMHAAGTTPAPAVQPNPRSRRKIHVDIWGGPLQTGDGRPLTVENLNPGNLLGRLTLEQGAMGTLTWTLDSGQPGKRLTVRPELAPEGSVRLYLMQQLLRQKILPESAPRLVIERSVDMIVSVAIDQPVAVEGLWAVQTRGGLSGSRLFVRASMADEAEPTICWNITVYSGESEP